MKLYEVNRKWLSAVHVSILLEILTTIASHSSEVRGQTAMQLKFQKACSLLEIPGPPVVHFENESHQNLLKVLHTLLIEDRFLSNELKIESQVVTTCQNMFQIYLNCAGKLTTEVSDIRPKLHWIVPLNANKKEELAARTSLLVLSLQVLGSLEKDSLRRNLRIIFPSLVNLISCEHSSSKVKNALFDIFHSSIGPHIMTL